MANLIDNAWVTALWGTIKEKLSGKQNALTPDDTLTLDGNKIWVTTPIRGIYTQEEFDALPEDIKAKGMFVIKTAGGSGGSGGSLSVPSGVIWPWYHGEGETVPDGWALCDGQNGTPDLRGRFLLGASASHPIGQTGGSENVTLNIGEIPLHSHSFSGNFGPITTSAAGEHNHQLNTVGTAKEGKVLNNNGTTQRVVSNAGGEVMWPAPNHTHTVSGSVSGSTSSIGSSGAHNNMPPYFAIDYIMKL